MNDRRYNREKQTIHLSEIERYRKDLQIGQQVEIRTRRTDFEDGTRTVHKMCTVDEKHRWLFMARDQKGKRYAVTYIEMMVKDG